MEPDPEQVAADWIAYARYDPNHAPDGIFARGWRIDDLACDDPALARKAIKVVAGTYREDELSSATATEAIGVVGRTAAGEIRASVQAAAGEFHGRSAESIRCRQWQSMPRNL